MTKFRGWLSVQVAKHPKRVVLVLIILFNVLFITFSAALISSSFSARNRENEFLPRRLLYGDDDP